MKMMKMMLVLSVLFFASRRAHAEDLPVSALKGSDTTKPLVLYISGDGRLVNSFSSAFMKKLNEKCYSVVGLDAKSYFWSRTKPQQAADDVSKVLHEYL